MKLFPKLALWMSAVVLAGILSVSLWVYAHDKRDVEEHAQAEQRAVLQNLAHIAWEAIIHEDDLLLVKYIRLLRQWNPGLMSASVVGPKGWVIAHSEPSRIGRMPMEEPPGTSYGFTLSQPIELGSRRLGTASVTFSQELLQEILQARLAELRRRLTVMTLGTLLVAILASFYAALSWTRPIKRLAKVADQIGQENWKLDLGNLPGRRDELGILADSFAAMAARLQELDQMKEDFVSAVTHELRSPLSAIDSFLNQIEHERPEENYPPAWDDYHRRMRVNTQRLNHFIDDLLDVASLDRGKIQLDRRRLDVATLAKDILMPFELKLEERAIVADIAIPEELPAIWADADKIHQVLTNLVSNAIKFTPDGGKIQLRAESIPDKTVRISVSDTGIGIPKEDQARIFNKFEQVRGVRQAVKGPKGTGLGLAISRQLIELHGGQIGVRSQPGQGSTFYFTIPAYQAAIAPALTPQGAYS